MKLNIDKGTTSKTNLIFIQDTSSSIGAGLTGLAFGSSGLAWHYYREAAGTGATQVTLATQTIGTWATGGFIELDAADMPGWYEIGIPNAALATGAGFVGMVLKGAANMAQLNIEIQLTNPIGVKKNTAFSDIPFLMVDATDNVTPETGLTISGTRSIDGAAYGAVTGSFAEVANGTYQFDASAADLNGDMIMFRFTATGAADRFLTIQTTP